MEKAWKDLRHARTAHPDAKHIFLVCTESTPPSRLNAILRTAGRCYRKHDVQVHLFDGRKIAETIVDSLLESDAAIDDLAEFLPQLRYVRDEYEASLLCPEVGVEYLARSDVEQSISDALDTQSCVVIAGIGGSGKSKIAAAVARKRKPNYDLIIWYDAENLRRVEQLHALPFVRSGHQRNVPTLLRTLRCLLVLDDLTVELDLQALAAFCGPGSQILITTRFGSANAYPMPALNRSQAEAMLTRALPQTCPIQTADRVWNTVGGHPLTLRLMNAALRDQKATWSDIEEDCAVAGEFTDDRQERVTDRILKRLMPSVRQELSLFAWIETPACDRGFVRSVLKPVGIRKLINFCLLTADAGSSIRIQDIVHSCLRAEISVPLDDSSAYTNALDQYISGVYDKDLELVSVCYGMRQKLESLVRSGDRRSTFLYGLLQSADAANIDQDVVGDVSAYVRHLQAEKTHDEIAIAVALEAIEWSYRYEKAASDITTAKARLTTYIPIYDELRKLPGLTSRSVAEIEHHLAKTLNLTGDKTNAVRGFEAVLAGACPLDASRLQLIRIYGRDSTTAARAEELAVEVLERASRHEENVATSVVLAAVEAFPWTSLREQRTQISNKYGSVIEERILAAAAAGSEQSYQTFASIGRHWIWNDPDRFKRVWLALPRRSAEEMWSDSNRFAYADILRQAAQADSLTAEEKIKLREESLVVFNAIQQPSPYQVRNKGQLLIDMDRSADGEAVLLSISDPKQEPWRSYYLSKARSALGRPKEALDDINNAISMTKSSSEYFATFKAQRCDIRIALRDPDAMDDLRDAIAACKNERFQKILANRLTTIQKGES